MRRILVILALLVSLAAPVFAQQVFDSPPGTCLVHQSGTEHTVVLTWVNTDPNLSHTVRITRGLPSSSWTSFSANQILGATNVTSVTNGTTTVTMTLPSNPTAYSPVPVEDGQGTFDVIWRFTVQAQSATQNSPESTQACKYIVASGGSPPDTTPPTPPTNLTVTPQ